MCNDVGKGKNEIICAMMGGSPIRGPTSSHPHVAQPACMMLALLKCLPISPLSVEPFLVKELGFVLCKRNGHVICHRSCSYRNFLWVNLRAFGPV